MKNFDFIKNRKICLIISLAILTVGLIFNLIFGVELDIAFKGGTLLKYSYDGTVDESAVSEFIVSKIPGAVVDITEDGENGFNVITVSLTDELDSKTQTTFKDTLSKQFPDSKIAELSTNSLQPSNGRAFFIKCLVAIALASIFLVIYVGFRFRRIGGFSAGVMALLALLHDILIAYFTFVVFRIPLNDNFVAVVLTILGYSLNDTIVIYDRIRENRRKMDKKSTISDVVNLSLHQSLTRNIITSVCVFIAIATVTVIALITSMEAIISFALPMTVGVVAGFYSSTYLCTPMWAWWIEKRESKPKKKK